ncbi:MAG: hypothetical protein EP326_14015 [Deltaproteobacteria bacterium]|nr:MAG: hypothetical protein EP326_14015 [Deltaproteobacteria bacterium]
MKLGCFVLTLLLLSTSSFGYEKSDAFMVTIMERSIKVLSPDKYNAKQGIVLTNNTLVKVVGKVIDENDKVLKFVSIEPGMYKSIEINFSKDGKIFFVPMAPSFQEVELVFGKKAYEVPPKK